MNESMTRNEWENCWDIGAILDALKGRTNLGVMEEFFAKEYFSFPNFAAILVCECWKQNLKLKDSEWVKCQWPTNDDSVRACIVLKEMFKGVFV